MNKFLKCIFLIFAIIMFCGTILLFYSDVKILFLRESAGYLSKINDPNRAASIIFLVTYVVILIFFWKKIKLHIYLTLSILFILWFVSGRSVAFKYFPEGRVITGWYYIETDNFYISKGQMDYEKVITKETSIEILSFWRIRIQNKMIDRTLFIGPFVWENSLIVLNQDIGKFNSR